MEDLRPHFAQSALCLEDRVDPKRGLGASERLQFLLDARKQVNGKRPTKPSCAGCLDLATLASWHDVEVRKKSSRCWGSIGRVA